MGRDELRERLTELYEHYSKEREFFHDQEIAFTGALQAIETLMQEFKDENIPSDGGEGGNSQGHSQGGE
jgi:hypothetical protein